MLISYRFSEFRELDKLYPSGFDNDLDSMKTAINSVQMATISTLESELDVMEKEMENDIVIDNVIEYSNVDYLDYSSKSNAVNLILNSLIISIYSFLETRLKLFCKLIEGRSDITLGDISDTGIRQCRKYLAKVHKIDFEEVNEEWELIKSYALLRNKLAHSHLIKLHKVSNAKEINKLKKIKYIHEEVEQDYVLMYLKDGKVINEAFKTISNFLRFVCYVKKH